MQHFRSHRQQSPQQKPSVSQVSQHPAAEIAHSASSMPGNSRNDHGGSHMQIAEQPKRVSMPEEQHLLSAEQESSREKAARAAMTQGTDSCSCDGANFDVAEGGMRCHGLDDQVPGKLGFRALQWQHAAITGAAGSITLAGHCSSVSSLNLMSLKLSAG